MTQQLQLQLEAAKKAIGRVQNLHNKIQTHEGDFCEYCSFILDDYSEAQWPCATIQELNYENSESFR